MLDAKRAAESPALSPRCVGSLLDGDEIISNARVETNQGFPSTRSDWNMVKSKSPGD